MFPPCLNEFRALNYLSPNGEDSCFCIPEGIPTSRFVVLTKLVNPTNQRHFHKRRSDDLCHDSTRSPYGRV